MSEEEGSSNDYDLSYSPPLHSSDPAASGLSRQRSTSKAAVVYEQQIWEGEIIDEKYVNYGYGRLRRHYLVHWKPSWIDGGRLAAPLLVQNWKEKKAWK